MPHNTDIDPNLINHIRNILQDDLFLRCVFPCIDDSPVFDINNNEISSRCMLEKKDVDKAKAQKDGLDDVIIRIRSFKSQPQLREHILKVNISFSFYAYILISFVNIHFIYFLIGYGSH
jgi:hypothetical protein